jgi:hypothetical protein
VGNTSTSFASFDLGTAAASVVNVSGGAIVLQTQASAGSGPRDFRNQAGSVTVTGGKLQLGKCVLAGRADVLPARDRSGS